VQYTDTVRRHNRIGELEKQRQAGVEVEALEVAVGAGPGVEIVTPELPLEIKRRSLEIPSEQLDAIGSRPQGRLQEAVNSGLTLQAAERLAEPIELEDAPGALREILRDPDLVALRRTERRDEFAVAATRNEVAGLQRQATHDAPSDYNALDRTPAPLVPLSSHGHDPLTVRIVERLAQLADRVTQGVIDREPAVPDGVHELFPGDHVVCVAQKFGEDLQRLALDIVDEQTIEAQLEARFVILDRPRPESVQRVGVTTTSVGCFEIHFRCRPLSGMRRTGVPDIGPMPPSQTSRLKARFPTH
jgi:hypothetical protein